MKKQPSQQQSNHLYTPYYCEENVWHLAQTDVLSEVEKQVVFISNSRRSCPLWNQRACPNPNEPIMWDYHVILLALQDHNWQVWDLDTLLGMPVPAWQYIEQTFLVMGQTSPSFEPSFKVIDASRFVESFSSDRHHMRDRQGAWLAPPPKWPAILQSSQSNLQEMNDVTSNLHGEVVDIDEFMRRFAHK